MQNAIVRRQPELVDKLARTRQLMCEGVKDCLVTGYEHLIDALELPDVDDRHVLAASIRCGAQVLVTNNVTDFPAGCSHDYTLRGRALAER